MPLLDVQDLRVSFETEDGELNAVRGISFSIDEGQTFGIVGESGSGKSVTTQAIVGLLKEATVTGRAEFRGQDLLSMSSEQLRRTRGSEIGMVFQDPLSSLHPQFRVGAQIVEAIQAHERVSDRDGRKRALELMEMVGLADPTRRFREFPHQFSGGMRQRTMIAMAVALRPPLIIADEPTTALDVTVQAQILHLLKDLQHQHGTAIAMITHDLGVLAGMADTVMTMYAGRMVETGSRRDTYYAPHHPYTQGLLECVPGHSAPGHALAAIPGQPPSLLALPAGCVFRSRCPRAMPVCDQDPPVRDLGRGHLSYCWLPAQEVVERTRPTWTASERSPTPSGSRPEVLLSAQGLVKHFPVPRRALRGTEKVVHAVCGVDLEVREGETLGIVGESGCGKSTLARLLTGLTPPTSGEIRYRGERISGLAEKDMRPYRRDIQMIFQDPYGSLNPRRRVGSIMAEPFVIHGDVDGRGASLRTRVQALMEMVGLNPEHYNRFPADFSGGQRQRIGIARALATRPRLLVCDEPVSALDVSIQAQIINLLKSLQRELGLTYVFIAHDLSVVQHISDRTAVMYLGGMAEVGATAEVFGAPRHPYTRALLAAAPVADPDTADARSAPALAGEISSPINPPAGCRFHPRCPRRQGSCVQERPGLTPSTAAANASLAACFFPLDTFSGAGVPLASVPATVQAPRAG